MAAAAPDDIVLNCIAAAVAGAIQISMFNPLDCLRIRWQVAKAPPASLGAFTASIVTREGFVRGLLLPGQPWNCGAVAVAQGLRFGFYPTVRDALSGGGGEGSSSSSSTTMIRPDVMALAGLLSGSLGYFVAAPLVLLKTQGHAAAELGASNMAARPATLSGLWLGCTPMVLRGALLTAGQMSGYDASKRVGRRLGATDGPLLIAGAAGVAALSASTLAAPADVLQTRVQSRGGGGDPISLARHAAEIVREGGVAGLFRGWSLSVARLGPTFLVGTSIYEQCRRWMGMGYL